MPGELERLDAFQGCFPHREFAGVGAHLDASQRLLQLLVFAVHSVHVRRVRTFFDRLKIVVIDVLAHTRTPVNFRHAA